MSLNGLDSPDVKEAYDAAVSEPGGWFLLKYASRDELDLLGRGSGGIVEMRTNIAQYEDASPLYGLLKYRRRNVIIKYLPESCSRLVQARVTVHFNTVCEKFTPYNTTFSIATAKELKDTKLSAACSLHTASSSTSSTSSLRRRRLIEIAEEEEEEQQAAKRQSVLKEEDRPTTREGVSSQPVILNSELASSPDASKFSTRTDPPPFVGVDDYQFTQAELLSYAATYGKPKVKLGPRPSADVGGRPRTPGSTGNYRPVSSIPAGFKLMSKGSRRGRDNNNNNNSSSNNNTHEPEKQNEQTDVVHVDIEVVEAEPARPNTSNGRPVTSSGLSTKSAATTTTKRSGMTPEMVRLKKAMKLREKKMNAQPSTPDADGDEESRQLYELSEDVTDTSVTDSLPVNHAASSEDPTPDATSASADSAVDHVSLNTQTTDSHPASPMAMSSDVGDSTKASSLSESTDETIQAVSEEPKESKESRESEEPEEPEESQESKESKEEDGALQQRAPVDPLQTRVGIDRKKTHSHANLSDDEDLMEELHSATVQEAKPISVSKSPITPAFPTPSLRPGSSQKDESTPIARTASNPVQGSFLAPGDTAFATRSASSGAAFLQKMSQQSTNAASKKPNVGSSISQRIKALEKLSEGGRAAVPEGPARLDRPSSTFFAVRKTSGGRDGAKTPSLADRTLSLTKDAASSSESRETSPETHKPRERSGSLANRLSVFEGGHLPMGRPETIQVKARILRDPTQSSKVPDTPADPSELRPLNLKQSPLIVDHQKASPALAPAPTFTVPNYDKPSKKATIQERRMSRDRRHSQSQDEGSVAGDDEADDTRSRRRSSLSIVKDFIKERRSSFLGPRPPTADNPEGSMSTMSLPTPSKSPSRPPSVHNNSGLARRLSISSRRSSISKDRDANSATGVPLSPSLMTEASGSGDESRPSTSDPAHSKSRAGRFMRRLSSSFSSNRKVATPAISPTVAEEEEGSAGAGAGAEARTSAAAAAAEPTITSMGDVNVQFPDNLLWKRRNMCLDSQGFVILSTVNAIGERAAGTVKRYHLSEFRLPYIPEMEMQELPNSICLDFVDGPGLQIACSDRSSQTNVLQVLQEAHQSHTSFGQ